MLVYGAKSKKILSETLHEKCPNCGTQNSVQMVILQKYAHLFWIPSFPTGKTATTECKFCKQKFNLKEMPEAFREEYKILKSKTKAPLYTYSGLIIFIVLLGLVFFNSDRNRRKNHELIKSPQKGDIYELRIEGYHYTLQKVNRVSGDTVFVYEHMMETDKISGIAELKSKGDKAYKELELPFTKNKLSKMLEDGDIIDIKRK